MTFDIVRGPEELRRLVPALDAANLLPAPCLAADPEYLAAGFEGQVPCAALAREGDRPVGYLPFVARRSTYPLRVGPARLASLPYRQLRILSYSGPAEERDGVLAGLCDHLASFTRGAYHVALLSEIIEGDPLTGRVAERFGGDGASTDRKSFDSYRIDLRGSYGDYLARRMSSKTRGTLRRKIRAFAKECGGDPVLEVATTAEQVDSFLVRAEAVARRTYQWRRGYHVARDTAESRRRLAHLAGRRLWRGYLLSAGTTPVAYCQGTVYGGKFDYEIPGFDERFARWSPGLVLLDRILDDLFRTQVADHLDFGAGPGEYKRMFATSNPRVVYLSIYPRRPYPRLLGRIDGICRGLSAAGRRCAVALDVRRKSAAPAAESN